MRFLAIGLVLASALLGLAPEVLHLPLIWLLETVPLYATEPPARATVIVILFPKS